MRRRGSRRDSEGDYDALAGPTPARWLELDEAERLRLVEGYHRGARIRVPNLRAHGMIHVVVENQLAEDVEAAVAALDRLMSGGLDRHEAVHAIGSVLAEKIFSVLRDREPDSGEYVQELEALTVEKWRGGGR